MTPHLATALSAVVDEIRADLDLVQADLDANNLAAAALQIQAAARRALKVADDLRAGREVGA